MNKFRYTKTLLLAAACALGLAGTARAQSANVAVPVPSGGPPAGLIGTNYIHTSYSFIDFDGTGVDGHGLNLAFNQNLRDGLDAQLGYSHLRSESFAGGRLREQALDFGVRAYTFYNGFKPFAAAGLGWVWDKAPLGVRDDSFTWFAGVGAEFAVTPALSLRPFVSYHDATDYHDGGTWNYGLRANHWLSQRVALTAAVVLDDDENVNWSAGINFRY